MSNPSQQPFMPWRGVASHWVGACLLCLLSQPVTAQQRLTLQEALDLAERNHPQVAAARAQLAPAQADLAEARAPLWNNPEFGIEARRRTPMQPGADSSRHGDAAVGLTQTFEVAGQPRARRAAAQASLQVARYAAEQTRRDIRLEAARRFVEALHLQELLDAQLAAAQLLDQAAQVVSKRVNAGEDTRLGGNLALVEGERAAAQAGQTRDELVQARAALATTLQLPPQSLPEPAGSLTVEDPPYRLEDLLAALGSHPGLQAASAREQAANSQLELERAARYPDVTVGLSHGPERGIEGTVRVTTLSVSVPLPLFRHNGAAIARANAESVQSRIERQATQRDAEAAVRVLWLRLEQLRQLVRRLASTVLPALQENQRLSLAALHAGEINVSQFLLARRQTVEAQRDLADARAQAVLAQFELEGAAGWTRTLFAGPAATESPGTEECQ